MGNLQVSFIIVRHGLARVTSTISTWTKHRNSSSPSCAFYSGNSFWFVSRNSTLCKVPVAKSPQDARRIVFNMLCLVSCFWVFALGWIPSWRAWQVVLSCSWIHMLWHISFEPHFPSNRSLAGMTLSSKSVKHDSSEPLIQTTAHVAWKCPVSEWPRQKLQLWYWRDQKVPWIITRP